MMAAEIVGPSTKRFALILNYLRHWVVRSCSSFAWPASTDPSRSCCPRLPFGPVVGAACRSDADGSRSMICGVWQAGWCSDRTPDICWSCGSGGSAGWDW